MKLLLLITSFFTLISCGKSPLLLDKKSNEVSSHNEFETGKTLKTSHHNLSLKWLSTLNTTDPAHALLIVTNNSFAADLPSPFKIFLWMPEMGHGSSPITIKKLGTGLYELSDIYFIMDGLWQMRIQVINNGEVLEEQNYEYIL